MRPTYILIGSDVLFQWVFEESGMVFDYVSKYTSKQETGSLDRDQIMQRLLRNATTCKSNTDLYTALRKIATRFSKLRQTGM